MKIGDELSYGVCNRKLFKGHAKKKKKYTKH